MKIMMRILAILALLSVSLSCGRSPQQARQVVVYTAVDQEYAELIFREFEAATGIKVLAVFDAEANKTTGLVNRLVAERDRPLADVYWNNELAQILRLKTEHVLAPYSPPALVNRPGLFRDTEDCWTAFGGRARVLIVNTSLLSPDRYPHSIRDMLSDSWAADRIGLSHPLFGTSAAHASALYAVWGPEKAHVFYETIRKRGVRIADGNAVIRDMVVDGRLDWAMVDNDDAEVALRKGDPIAMILPDQDGEGAYVMPNSVGLIAGAPHPEAARSLVDFILAATTEKRLADAGLLLPVGVEFKRFAVNYESQGPWFQVSHDDLAKLFVN